MGKEESDKVYANPSPYSLLWEEDKMLSSLKYAFNKHSVMPVRLSKVELEIKQKVRLIASIIPAWEFRWRLPATFLARIKDQCRLLRATFR